MELQKHLGIFDLGRVKGTLDENGEATFSCPSSSRLKELPGMAKVIADIDVMEGGSGRSTQKKRLPLFIPKTLYRFAHWCREYWARKVVSYFGCCRRLGQNVIKDISDVIIQKSQVEIEYSWYYDEDDFSYSRQQYKQENTA